MAIDRKKLADRQPPTKPVSSLQYDLFQTFVANDTSEISNTIEVWESIPKYFLTPRQMDKLRTDKGHADPYVWDYTYKEKAYRVKIQPALIEQKDGRYKAFFPSVTEELIEEALKKIFTDQNYGIHDPDKAESWIRFSLSMIHKELKRRGRERNRTQIKHAIEVMSSCVITLYQEGKEVYKGAILSDLVTVDRETYLKDSNAYHIARLPVFISQGINRLQYRQFNYGRLMECDEQLTRWIYKRLVHRFRQASMLNSYHFLFSDVERNSGLLQQGTEQRNREKVISALEELKEKQVLCSYTSEAQKEGRKIIDIKYILQATPGFITEQKAANKRMHDNELQAQEAQLLTQ